MLVPTRTLGVVLVFLFCAAVHWIGTAQPLFNLRSYQAGIAYMKSEPVALRAVTFAECKTYVADGMAEAAGYSQSSFVSGCYEVVLSGE